MQGVLLFVVKSRIIRGVTEVGMLGRFEESIAARLRAVPSLPQQWRTWLGDNIWWIAIIGVLGCLVAILTGASVLMGGAALVGGLAITGYVPSILTPWTLTALLVTLIFTSIEMVLLLAAITPLRSKEKAGWNLLFYALFVTTAAVVVGAAMTLSAAGFIMELLSGAVGVLIALYFTFQIRGEFKNRSAPPKTIAAGTTKGATEAFEQ